MKITKNTVFITGGNSGIGRALVKAFVEAGNQVITCGRDKETLKALKGEFPDVEVIRADLKSDRALRMLARKAVNANILINNAGILKAADIVKDDYIVQNAEDEMDTNFFIPLRLIKLLIPHLEQKENSAIINITSVVPVKPYDQISTYSASKAALHSFTQSLRASLKNTKVFEVFPNGTDTPMVAGFDFEKVSPDFVAQEVMRGLEKNEYEIWPGKGFISKLLGK